MIKPILTNTTWFCIICMWRLSNYTVLSVVWFKKNSNWIHKWINLFMLKFILIYDKKKIYKIVKCKCLLKILNVTGLSVVKLHNACTCSWCIIMESCIFNQIVFHCFFLLIDYFLLISLLNSITTNFILLLS